MGAHPGLLLAVATSILIILPGTHQYPLSVVFQPITFQLPSTDEIDSDLSFVYPSTVQKYSQSSEDISNQLICKKIHHGEGLYRVAPTAQAGQLFFIPSPVTQPLSDSALSRYYVAVPSVSPVGASPEDISSEVPEGAFAPSPPLMASLCVSPESPRPFPVLFAPPPPSQFSSNDNDFRKEMYRNQFGAPLYSTPIPGSVNPLEISIGGVRLGLRDVPATIESSSPSMDDPAGRIRVKLHTNPPGSIDLGFIGGEKTYRWPEEVYTDYNTPSKSDVNHSEPPSVSLLFKRPMGFMGLGSANAPSVNIEKKTIASSAEKSQEYTVPKN